MAPPSATNEKKTSIDESAIRDGSDPRRRGSRIAQSGEFVDDNDRALAEQYGYQPVSLRTTGNVTPFH